MNKAMLFLVLFGVLAGCGGEARGPLGATITGPADGANTALPPGGGSVTFRNVEFLVKSKEGTAIPGVEVEFFVDGTAFLSNVDGVQIGNGLYVTKTTNDQGVVDISFVTLLPVCSAAEDRVFTSGVSATIGTASDAVIVTHTVTKCS